jgi:hypothetical protein
MKMSRLVSAAVALCAAAAFAQPSPLQQQLERLRALQAQRPDDGLLVYYEAMTQAQLGEPAAAVTQTLQPLLGRRLGLVPPKNAGFDDVWHDAGFQALRRRLAEDEPRTEPDAPVVRTLVDPKLVPEGIAWDAKRRRHLVGSIAQRKIVSVDARGRVRDFSRPGDRLETVLGLAVDAAARRLCAVSTNGFLDAGRERPRNAVVCWSLATRRIVARADWTEARQLNDLAFDGQGALYVSDSAEGSVWHWQPGAAPRRVGEAGSMRGANGLAGAPDGALYATLATGIARIEPASGRVERLAQPAAAVSGGIDGLYWHDGDLVGVQNGPNPGRVIRIVLADGGRRIDAVHVLQSHHHPAFAEPTTGVVVGDSLHVIANSYVGHFRPDGTIDEPQALEATRIVAVPLRRPAS